MNESIVFSVGLRSFFKKKLRRLPKGFRGVGRAHKLFGRAPKIFDEVRKVSTKFSKSVTTFERNPKGLGENRSVINRLFF